ncbi:DUF742 domain-containing protein [Actinoallomurus oryzae]|jgi:hypothetical protein|uniref:DUF742 domain-containing protein n=1 Tax=Actinoallomurus oryzae TaxID=502180 RepID=A0ABP8PHH3_9ACTN
MSPRFDGEEPDRLYTVTGGRSHADENRLDIVTLIVSESGPEPGMQSEHAKILAMCTGPLSVVEISAELGLPVTIVKILLADLLDTGHVTARTPVPTSRWSQLPDVELLKQVLIGLQNL